MVLSKRYDDNDEDNTSNVCPFIYDENWKIGILLMDKEQG